ncbi:MAG TPA: hypothetical protein VM554_05395 [Acidisarcina sp.]|nr:hypothetical protein [Acidisarcina sp.]
MSEMVTTTKCRCLRSKSSYGAFGEDIEELESTAGATTTYWCLKTMGKSGPDEHFVHKSLCRDGRACYEPRDED